MLKFGNKLNDKSIRRASWGAGMVLAGLAAGCLLLPALAEAGSQADKPVQKMRHGQTQGSLAATSSGGTRTKVSPYVIASRQHAEELRAAHSHSTPVQSPALGLAGRRPHKQPGQVQR